MSHIKLNLYLEFYNYDRFLVRVIGFVKIYLAVLRNYEINRIWEPLI